MEKLRDEGLLEDHPRVCGEQVEFSGATPYDVGSPPRVRGTAKSGSLRSLSAGITPACAGNSLSLVLPCSAEKYHPRVCGEQLAQLGLVQSVKGSPPRVRGTVPSVAVNVPDKRITPACAGNSPVPSQPPSPHEDHPRVCGEQLFASYPVASEVGSPPRVRGTETVYIDGFACSRITPACAGNSCISCRNRANT